jgi:arylsulfatase A-like enzyme
MWKKLICVVSALVGLSQLLAAKPADMRPNIIFLLSDDQRDGTFAAMGQPWVKTPHVDQLIHNGVRFANTYIAEPTCMPSRAALFTGVHERVNGIGFSSPYALSDEQWAQSYPALMRNAGYFTGFIGKFGIERYTFRGQADKKFDFWRGYDGWAKFWVRERPGCEILWDSEYDIITDVDGDSIQRFLAAAPSDKPFCLSVSFAVPHGSQTMSMYGPRGMTWAANENPKLKGNPFYDTLYRPLPGTIPEDTATDAGRFIPESILNQEHGRKALYEYNYTRPTCTEHWIRYYQQISAMDKSIGDMMATLKRKGLDQNTVVIFCSDNGLLMGEYGMGGKALLYDLASKVPTFIYDPRLPEAMRGRTDKHLVSSLDLTPTILDYAGIPAPSHMEGRSLQPLMLNENVPWREELFLENLFTLRGTPLQEGIRRDRWKYVRMFKVPKPVYLYEDEDLLSLGLRKPDFEQLFDLKHDPTEHHNLVEAYEGTPLLDELRTACQQQSDALNRASAIYRRSFPPITKVEAYARDMRAKEKK